MFFTLPAGPVSHNVAAKLKWALSVSTSDHGSPKRKKLCRTKDLCGVCGKDIQQLSEAMIQCDYCNQWFHYICVNVSAADAETIEFVCPTGCIYS